MTVETVIGSGRPTVEVQLCCVGESGRVVLADEIDIHGATVAHRPRISATIAGITAPAAASSGFHVTAVAPTAYFAEMNTIYRQTFPEPLPARTTIQTPLPGFGIEVDVVLHLGD